MLNRFFGKNIHTHLHILGLSGLAAGVPLNKVLMSVSMMFIVLNLLLEADFTSYWSHLKKNRYFHWVLLFFIIHVIGILWSTNVDYAMHDLKVKLPLLVIATTLSAKPVTLKSNIHLILFAFTASVLITSVLNFGMYHQWFFHQEYTDIRGMSFFCSHVRYGLIVSMAVGVFIYFFFAFPKQRLFIVPIIIWLLFYTFYSQVISGALSLVAVLIALIIFKFWHRFKFIVSALLATILICSALIIMWLFTPFKDDVGSLADLPTHSKEGNPYIHYDRMIAPETGKSIYLYICDEELDRDWEKYSAIPIDSLDGKGHPIKFTIIRYLASKDLTKDAEGLSKLVPADIENIENGIASSINYGFIGRLYALKYQLINNHDPNGNSFLERLEYWKTGMGIFQDNWMSGVGTGDVQDAFNDAYIATNTELLEENRHRAHNMFLTVGITFGIVGVLFFLWFHSRYLMTAIRNRHFLAISFMLIALFSFCIEDTLETQTGITFYALFYALFASSSLKMEQ